MATEYSLTEAFKRIEEELIKSMIRNFEKHKAEELDEGFNWDQWQVVQLRELERYRKQNLEKFGEEFEILNGELEDLLRMTSEDAQTEEEARILREIGEGLFPEDEEPGISLGAFGINEDKLNSLIKSTTDDLEKAEHAVLRRSNDIYRQVIHDAQVYAASGGTYEQAVDMATKDFARRGITSIVYKNGSRHTIQDYASMAIRTAMKRAYLMGEGQKNAEYGIHTVRVNKRQGACPLCLRWVGKVLIDDVYGGGTKEEARQKRLPLLSTAMAKGFLHPNCKDVYSLYIEGVSQPAEPWSEYDLKVLADQYNYEQKEKHAKTMIQSWTRVAETRLDPENKRKAEALADGWRSSLSDIQELAGMSPHGSRRRLRIDLQPYEDLVASLKRYKIPAVPVKPLQRQLAHEEILDKLARLDPTAGSCSSVSMAYIANKAGYDVQDYRGGDSQDWFSRKGWKVQALKEWFGVKGKYEVTREEIKTVQTWLTSLDPKKEYLIGAGAHTTIVCRDQNTPIVWYLELQRGRSAAGWKQLTEKALIERFNCKKQRKRPNVAYIIETDTLAKADEFIRMLDYINTL